MSYDFKTLLNGLLEELTPAMTNFGFKLKKSERKFEAKTSSGVNRLFLGIITHPGTDFDVTAGIGIRFDAVEDITNEFNGTNFLSVDEKSKKLTSTMGCEFGNLSGVGQKRWNVARAENVQPAVIGILEDFKSFGLPYIEKYSSLNAALAALSGNEKANWLHMPLHGARCKKAITIAYLLKDRARFNFLVNQSREFLKSRNDFDLPAFERLTSKLSSEF